MAEARTSKKDEFYTQLKTIEDELLHYHGIFRSKHPATLKEQRLSTQTSIKRSEFDILYYGLFFADKIAIFTLKTKDVMGTPGYSDFQHKGNEGEGQFHLHNKSIKYHMDNHFKEWLTYEQIYDIFEKHKI